jgi:DNA-directed RNA polymerase subunit RPC12/RpoP
MSILDVPRCPNCNSEIALKELWKAAPKSGRGSGLAGKIGIVCPVCGIKLRVLDHRVRIASVGLFILMICSAAAVGNLTRSYGQERAIFIAFWAVCFLGGIVFVKSIPRLLQLRLFEQGEEAGFPLVTLAEDLVAQREAAVENPSNAEPADYSGAAWTCSKCGEENPGNFNECWKCLAMRPGVEAEIGRETAE